MMPESRKLSLDDVHYHGTEPGSIGVSVLLIKDSERELVNGEYNIHGRLSALEVFKKMLVDIFLMALRSLRRISRCFFCACPGELCETRAVASCFNTSLSANAARLRSECQNWLQKHSRRCACFIFLTRHSCRRGCKCCVVSWPKCRPLILFH